MHLKVFYILACVSLFGLSYETDDYETHAVESLSSVDEDMLGTLDSSKKDHDNYIKEQPDDADSEEESSSEDSVSFTGPVKAKGAVSVAANFGFDSPGPANYPYATNPVWFPFTFFPQYFFPTSPPAPIPFTFSHIPLVSIFLPQLGTAYPENALENLSTGEFKLKSTNKEIYLEMIPLKSGTEKPAASNLANLSDEPLCSDEILANPVFLDEDFTDYDGMDKEPNEPETDGSKSDDSKTPARMVYGGFVPASGAVRIAAKF